MSCWGCPRRAQPRRHAHMWPSTHCMTSYCQIFISATHGEPLIVCPQNTAYDMFLTFCLWLLCHRNDMICPEASRLMSCGLLYCHYHDGSEFSVSACLFLRHSFPKLSWHFQIGGMWQYCIMERDTHGLAYSSLSVTCLWQCHNSLIREESN